MDHAQLQRLLSDPAVENRLQAVRSLPLLNEVDESMLLLALGDDDWRVRKEAIAGFLQLDDATAQAAFIVDQLRNSENAGLRNAAIEILISLGERVAPLLLSRLSSEEADVRKFIVDIIGEINSTGCVLPLLPYLQDEDENVRYAVVETLGKLKSEQAVDSLLELLDSSDTGLQFTILAALTSIGRGISAERVIPYAQNSLLRKAVFTCLGELRDRAAVPSLLTGLSDPQRKNREVALLALGVLLKHLPDDELAELESPSAQLLTELVSYLRHDNPDLQRAACQVLSLCADPFAVQKILPLLSSELLRDDVVAACRRIPKTLFINLLEGVGPDDGDAVYLVYLLGELGFTEVEPLAMQGVRSNDPQLRYAATMTLGKIGAVNAVSQLATVLEDEIDEIRQAASDSLVQLARIETTAVNSAVTPYLESTEESLRELAVKTLSRISFAASGDYLLAALHDSSVAVRCAALRGLSGHQSADVLAGLTLAMADKEAAVRRLAVEGLAAFPDENIGQQLTLAMEDPDPWVRKQALGSLTGGDASQLNAILTRGLTDPVGLVVIAALETAQQQLPSQVDSLLSSALLHEDSEVVSAAVRLKCRADFCQDLLSHDRALVRQQAVREAIRGGHLLDKDFIEQCLVSESDAQVREALENLLRRGAVRTERV